MRVFVTGATGFIGSAVTSELRAAGHQVLGLARSTASAEALVTARAEVHGGSLDDLDSLCAGARISDGVVHLAFGHDFSDYAAAAQTDAAAIMALGAELEGSDRPLIIASGTLGLAIGRLGTEKDLPDRSAGPRVAGAEAALALAERGVRASVVRLAPSVHSEDKRGFVGRLVDIAGAQGVSGYLGDGTQRWPAVHRLDAAHLFCLALVHSPAGSVWHGVAAEGVRIRDIADVIGRHRGLPVRSVHDSEVAEHFGWLAGILGLDSPASSSLTREQLGWQPTRCGLLADLDRGHYFDRSAA